MFKSKINTCLVLMALTMIAVAGCTSSVETVDQQVELETYTGELSELPEATRTLFDASHSLVSETGQTIYLRSLIYDLDDELYQNALLRVTGVPRDVKGKATLTVDRVTVIEANLTEEEDTDSEAATEDTQEDQEDQADGETDADSEEDTEEPTEVADPEIEDVADLEDYRELESRPLEFKMFYPKDWYYAQVGKGYAFAKEPVSDESSENWVAYIKVAEGVNVEFDPNWISFGKDDFLIYGQEDLSEKLTIMIKTIESL